MDDRFHDTFVHGPRVISDNILTLDRVQSTDDARQSVTRGQHEDLDPYPQGPTMANVQPQPTAASGDVYPGFNQQPPSVDMFSYQAFQTRSTLTTGPSNTAFNGGCMNAHSQLLQPPFLGNAFNNPLSDFRWLPSTEPVMDPYAPGYNIPSAFNQPNQEISRYVTNMPEEQFDPLFSQAGFGTMPSHLGGPALSNFDAFSGLDTSENALRLRLQPQSMNPGVAEYNVHAPPADQLIVANPAHNLPQFHAIASSTTRSTPEVTDDSGTSSSSTTSQPSGSHSENSDPVQTPQPSAEMHTGKIMPCAWRQHFGGNCKDIFHQKQQLDRHLLTHLPDADGTVWNSYVCTECARNTEPGGTKVGKKPKGFSRRDAGLRHVRTCHRDAIENGDESSLLIEVEWPWWWPSELFRTPKFSDLTKVGPRPLGETRDWEGYLRDVISKYPKVVNQPKGAKQRRGQAYRPY